MSQDDPKPSDSSRHFTPGVDVGVGRGGEGGAARPLVSFSPEDYEVPAPPTAAAASSSSAVAAPAVGGSSDTSSISTASSCGGGGSGGANNNNGNIVNNNNVLYFQTPTSSSSLHNQPGPMVVANFPRSTRKNLLVRQESHDLADEEDNRCHEVSPAPPPAAATSSPLQPPPPPLPSRPTRLGGLHRALTLPSSCAAEVLKSPLRGCRPPVPGVAIREEEESFMGSGGIEITVPPSLPAASITVDPSVPSVPLSGGSNPSPLMRTGSVDNNLISMVIPTFTVTINPMEDDEMTFVPDSPGEESIPPRTSSIGEKMRSGGGGGGGAGGGSGVSKLHSKLAKQLSIEVHK